MCVIHVVKVIYHVKGQSSSELSDVYIIYTTVQ